MVLKCDGPPQTYRDSLPCLGFEPGAEFDKPRHGEVADEKLIREMDLEREVKRRTAESLITKLSSVSDQTRTAALCELRLLSKTDPDIRPIIATLDDGAAISYLSESLYSATPLSQENAAATLLNLSISCKDPLVSTRGLLDAISHALSRHRNGGYSPAAVQSAAATVYSLSLEPSHRGSIGSKRDILYALIDIVMTSDSPSRSVKDAVKALFSLSLHPPNRGTMLELDVAAALFGRVVNDGRVGLVEDVTAVIAQLAACEAAPAAFRVAGGVRVLVDLIDLSAGATGRVRENAVSALLKLVEFGGERVADEIREVGLGLVFDGLGEVVQCGSDKGKVRAQALMNVLDTGMSSIKFSENGGDFGSGPLLDSSHSY